MRQRQLNQERILLGVVNRKSILDEVLRRPGSSTKRIESAVGLTRTCVRRHLLVLKSEGKIVANKRYAFGQQWEWVWYPALSG